MSVLTGCIRAATRACLTQSMATAFCLEFPEFGSVTQQQKLRCLSGITQTAIRYQLCIPLGIIQSLLGQHSAVGQAPIGHQSISIQLLTTNGQAAASYQSGSIQSLVVHHIVTSGHQSDQNSALDRPQLGTSQTLVRHQLGSCIRQQTIIRQSQAVHQSVTSKAPDIISHASVMSLHWAGDMTSETSVCLTVTAMTATNLIFTLGQEPFGQLQICIRPLHCRQLAQQRCKGICFTFHLHMGAGTCRVSRVWMMGKGL